MAVAVAVDGEGDQHLLVSTSEPRGYLRPGIRLEVGDFLVSGLGHAERDLVEYCVKNAWTLLIIGATRPICDSCVALIEPIGAQVVISLKSDKTL